MNCEIAIVGSGIMGLSTAYHLCLRGIKNIVIVERQGYIGGHSTLRCTGGLRYQFASEINVDMSIENRKIIKKLQADNDLDFHFINCGYAFVVTDSERAEIYKEAVRMQNRKKIPTKIYSPDEFAQKVPQLNYKDVEFITYCEDEGILDVNRLITFLYGKLLNDGVTFLINEEVCGIDVAQDNFVVKTNKRDITAKKIVNAAGPWSKEIAAMVGLDLSINRAFQQVLVTSEIEGVNKDFPVVIFSDIGIGYHEESKGILTQYNRVYDETMKDFEHIDYDWFLKHCRIGVEKFKQLENSYPVTEWIGFYDETPDGNPIIGESRTVKSFYNLCGFNGHGFMHGLIAGKLLTEEITDGFVKTLNIDAFREERFSDFEKQTEVYKI